MSTPALRAMASFSRLVRFLPKGYSAPLIGEPVNSNQDVGLASFNNDDIIVELFSGSSMLAPGQRTGQTRKVHRLLSPLCAQEVGTIRCIGLNVSDGGALPAVLH